MSISPRWIQRSLVIAGALLGGALVGCHAAGPVSDVTAVYELPPSLDMLSEKTFFDHPWPSDLRIENGSPRLRGYYNPNQILIYRTYIESMSGVLDGFSPAGAGYLRFSGAIDPASLPATPKDALDPGASVQLIDIDPASPEHGQRKLVSFQWREEPGVYYMPNTLAFMPSVGFPLRPSTRYALVVTAALQARSGGSIAQSKTVAALVGATAPGVAAASASAALAPAIGEIEGAGIDRGGIVHLAVFTTADPVKELMAVRDGVVKTIQAPLAEPTQWKLAVTAASYDEYRGRFGPSPNYQVGTIPFTNLGDGGQFEFVDGEPVLQSTSDLRFSLMVPKASACPMPPGGYPIVLYSHGTGGNYRSYVSDGTGLSLATRCLATMGVDQIFQGTRPGAVPDATEAQIGLVFYNFNNPAAARTNGRQSAIDEVQRARLFTESHMEVPASISATKGAIRFDATKLMFFGHSQGGLTGPLFTAVDPSARGGVFSGSGAQISIALLDKTEPTPSVAGLVKSLLLGLEGEAASELDMFHPGMSLIQSLIDVEDPLHYARLQAIEPRKGFAPKSIYMTEGIRPDGTGDSYAPPLGTEAHGLATGLPLQSPFQRPIAQLAWGGAQPVTVAEAGLAGNLAGGRASGILAQWAPPAGIDGHFVVFDVAGARKQAGQFLQNLAADRRGRVPAP